MKIVVVGGGPCGLIMGHALLAAGISDFVILERRDQVVESVGTTLVLWPHTLRLLDQLGHNLFENSQALIPEIRRLLRLGKDGKIITATNLFAHVKENHGHPLALFERQKLIQLLYDNLPDRSKHILTGKNVVSLEEMSDGATVTCTDGSKYTGDIVIGADGVHSIMRNLTQKDNTVKSRKGSDFKCTYKILFGISVPVGTIKANEVSERAEGGVLVQCLTSSNSSCWFLYVPEKKGNEGPATKYTQEDMMAVAEKYKDFVIHVDEKDPNKFTTFGDVWAARDPERPCAMVDLQEGVAQKWSSGRMVLLGDAVGKMLPYLGLGVNMGAQHVVSIVNRLKVVAEKEQETGKLPSVEEWTCIFDEVKAEHLARLSRIVWLSSVTVRWATRINVVVLALYKLFPSLRKNDRMPADNIYSRLVSGNRVFNFLPERHVVKGLMPYKFHPEV